MAATAAATIFVKPSNFILIGHLEQKGSRSTPVARRGIEPNGTAAILPRPHGIVNSPNHKYPKTLREAAQKRNADQGHRSHDPDQGVSISRGNACRRAFLDVGSAVFFSTPNGNGHRIRGPIDVCSLNILLCRLLPPSPRVGGEADDTDAEKSEGGRFTRSKSRRGIAFCGPGGQDGG